VHWPLHASWIDALRYSGASQAKKVT
jgi:hypothetical protein